jgi:RNA polymerase sigma-70 factor (ECF subfamily)
LSLDFAKADSQITVEPLDRQSPEKLFERQWALALLAAVLEQLRKEYAEREKADQFEALKGCLTGSDDRTTSSELAQQLGMSDQAVRQAVHRMRKRFRELLYDEVRKTVADSAEIEDELKGLFASLAS